MNFYTNVYYSGSNILLRRNNRGVTEKVRINYSPSLFLISSKKSEFKTIDGRNVERIEFNNIYEQNDFKDLYKDVDNFEIHGEIGVEYQFISDYYGGDCEYDFRNIGVLFLDIETTSENGFPSITNPTEKVISIACKFKGKKTIFCLGEYKEKEDEEAFTYSDEQRLLRDFIEYLNVIQPDILSGWNVRFFDIPYLVNRCKRILDDSESKKLSPWNIIKHKIVNRNGYDAEVYELVGISILDYYELYRTFTYVNQESYKLDHIAYVELGERKMSYAEYDNISDFYKKNFQKFVEYNMKDTELVEKLEEKLKLMELAVALAYSAGVNYNDVFSQVKTWDVIIYNDLKKRGIMIPPKKSASKDDQYAGAYVKDPIVGMHDWVVSYDVNSLYPSLIIHYNISPETLIKKNFKGKINLKDILDRNRETDTFKCFEEAKKLNSAIAANGTMYTIEKRGFLPELMDKMYNERKEFKGKMIDSKKKLQEVNKELIKRGLI